MIGTVRPAREREAGRPARRPAEAFSCTTRRTRLKATSPRRHASTQRREHYFPTPDWLFDLGMPDGVWKTYSCIQRHANDDGQATLRRSTIAEECGCSIKTVDRRIRELEVRWNVLTVAKQHRADGGWAASRYTLRSVPDEHNIAHRRATVLKRKPAGDKPVDRSRGEGTPVTRGQATLVSHGEGTPVTPQELPTRELPKRRNYPPAAAGTRSRRVEAAQPVAALLAIEGLADQLAEWRQ